MIVCKCCGEEARWCGPTCGIEGCYQIHCDHCEMQYSCESDAVNAETFEEARAVMLAAYNKLERTPQTLKLVLQKLKEAQDVLRDVASIGNPRLASFNSLQERIRKMLKPEPPTTLRELEHDNESGGVVTKLPEGISCGSLSKCGFENCQNKKGITSRLVGFNNGKGEGVITVWLCELHNGYVDQSYQPTNYSMGAQVPVTGTNDNETE